MLTISKLKDYGEISERETQLCGDIVALVSKTILDEFIAAVEKSIPDDLEGCRLKLKIAETLTPLCDSSYLVQRMTAALAANEKTA